MDVAIVGGGPAGLLLAARCADAGLDVLVLEEHTLLGEPTHCTGVISLETAELTKVPDDVILKRVDRVFIDENGVGLAAGYKVVRARTCVLACGVSYRFQRQLGLGLPGAVAHTAQVEVDAAPDDAVGGRGDADRHRHIGRGVADLYVGRGVA